MYSGCEPLVKLSWIHSPQLVVWLNCAASNGMYSRDEAKITGMTLAWLIFNGMYVDDPPYLFRPTLRLAYCNGIRRRHCSPNPLNPMTLSPPTITMPKT